MAEQSRFTRAEPGVARSAVFMLPTVSVNTATIRAGVQQVAPELLEQTQSVTGLDVAEICRRHPEDLVNSRIAQPMIVSWWARSGLSPSIASRVSSSSRAPDQSPWAASASP